MINIYFLLFPLQRCLIVILLCNVVFKVFKPVFAHFFTTSTRSINTLITPLKEILQFLMCIKCFFLRVPPMLLILKQELRTILIKTTLPLRLHEGQFMAAVAEV